MKRMEYKLMMMVFLFIGQISFGANYERMRSSPSAGIWVKLEITFHRPKLDCLHGVGLCLDWTAGIDGGSPGAEKACPVRAMITADNKLIIEVTEQDLNSYEDGSTLKYFKDHTSITLEDPYTFSAETSRALGAPGPVTVKSGAYPVSCRNRIYSVSFQL